MILSVLLVLAAPASDWIDSFLAGSRALEEGSAHEARSALAQAWIGLPEHPPTAWQLACVHARLGEADTAFEWLQRSVALGGGEVALLEWDPDLESLRADPRFAQVAEILRARAEGARSLEPTPRLEGRRALAVGGAIASMGPDARTIATGRGADTLLYDTVAEEIVAALERPGESVASARLSPDGRHFVVSGSTESSPRTHFLRVFDAATGDFVRELETVGWQGDVQFSRDGRRMLGYGTGRDHSARIWNPADWSTLSTQGMHGDQYVLSGDGSRILVVQRGAMTSDIALWDVERAEWVHRLENVSTIPSSDMRFSADSSLALVVENQTGRTLVLDGRTGNVVHKIEPPASSGGVPTPKEALCSGACFLDATGEIALMDGKRSIEIRDARNGELRREFQAPGGTGWSLIDALAGGSAIALHGHVQPRCVLDAESGDVLWDLDGYPGFGMFKDDSGSWVGEAIWGGITTIRGARSGELRCELRGTALYTASVADLRRAEIWVGCRDGSVRCVSSRTGRQVRGWRHGTERIDDVATSPDGSLVATLDRAGVLRVAKAESGASIATVAPVAQSSRFPESLSLAFSHAGDALVIAGSRKEIAVHSAPDWTRRYVLESESPYSPFTWSPDGTSIAVRSEQGSVRIVDTRDGSHRAPEKHVPGRVECLAFEPDGTRIWIGTDQSKVHVFAVAEETATLVLDLSDLDIFDSVEIGSITFRGDGKLVVIASSGWGVVAAYDPADGRRLWNYEYDGGNPASLNSMFDTTGESVFVWGQGLWSTREVDARTGRTRRDFAGRFGEVELLSDGERFAARKGPELHVVDMQSGGTLWSRVEVENDGWLISSTAGFVDGTRAALDRIPFVMSEGSLPLDALAAAVLDPKKVRAAAEGVELTHARAPAIPSLTQVGSYARRVVLPAEDARIELEFEASSADGVRALEIVRDGVRTISSIDATSPTSRTISAAFELDSGCETEIRVRSLSRRGIASRALRITIRRE